MCYRAPGAADAAMVHHDTMSPYKHQRPQSPAAVSHANTYPYMQDKPRYALPVGATTPYDSPMYHGMPYQVSHLFHVITLYMRHNAAVVMFTSQEACVVIYVHDCLV